MTIPEQIRQIFPDADMIETRTHFRVDLMATMVVYTWRYLDQLLYVAFFSTGPEPKINYKQMWKMKRSLERKQEWKNGKEM